MSAGLDTVIWGKVVHFLRDWISKRVLVCVGLLENIKKIKKGVRAKKHTLRRARDREGK